MDKLNSVTYIIAYLNLYLTTEEKEKYKDFFQKAIELHKSEIESAYASGVCDQYRDERITSDSYYKKTYGDCSKKFDNCPK